MREKKQNGTMQMWMRKMVETQPVIDKFLCHSLALVFMVKAEWNA